MSERIITYREYGNLIEALTFKIKGNIPCVKFIYGPPRGSFPLIAHLSHHLNLELIADIEYVVAVDAFKSAEILLVDDVVETGSTIKELRRMGFINSKVASLFYKPEKCDIVAPDFYIQETDRWLKFPWEAPDEKPNRPGY